MWIGRDAGNEEHFAIVLDDNGERIFLRSLVNDKATLTSPRDRAEEHRHSGLVID